jgi:enterobactin synthetase component D
MSTPSPVAQRLTVMSDPFLRGGTLASIPIDAEPAAASLSETLHADERALIVAMSAPRRASFTAGRLALRAAVAQVAPHHELAPLLRTERGAPRMPDGLTGSISHKRTRAIAIAMASDSALVGLDLEERPTARDVDRPSIADRILTGLERDALHGLDALAHREATLLHFALKEAVYKAIDPYVGRYVRFTEVELDVVNNGTAAVRLLLPEPVIRTVRVDAHWRFDGPYIIAMAMSWRAR